MNLQEESNLEQEYKTRKLWYVVEYRGSMNSGLCKELGIVFNPRHTEATPEEFDKILGCLFAEGNGEFKIIGTYKYNTLEELNEIWK